MTNFTVGYSKRPLKEKLGIKDGDTVWIVKAPKGYLQSLKVKNSRKGPFNFIQVFAKSADEVQLRMPALKKKMPKDGMFWVSWPKKASGIKTDLDDNVVRVIGLETGLVDVKVAAIDDIWSGIKFVYRLKDRK